MRAKAPISKDQLSCFAGFSLITLLSIGGAIVAEESLFYLVPVILVFAMIAVIDFRPIFYLLLFLLPLSTEFEVTDSIATDMPTEPLMVGLMVIYPVFLFSRPRQINGAFFKHPIIIALVLHVLWVVISVLFSQVYLVSVKFALAKLWYVITFVFLATLIIKDETRFRKAFWLIFLPLFFTVLQTLIRHGMHDFAFSEVNSTVTPFYRNHVNYAAMNTLFLPFLLVARSWYPSGSGKRIFLNIAIVITLVGIYFAYTRACWVALGGAAVAYFILRARLLGWATLAGLVAGIVFFAYFMKDNRFVKYAPEFEQTIYHSDIKGHMEATYELKDVSSMERIYRWIAAMYMIQQHPLTGYGPGNFYPHYKSFTISSFETYVSENEERSTVHNYFLLMLVEQGAIGLFFFCAFTLVLFFYGQHIFSTTIDPARKRLVMALLLSLVIIYINLMLSDLLEADKVGTLFFLNVGLLVNLDLRNREDQKAGYSVSSQRNT